jgi:hypothetical protein
MVAVYNGKGKKFQFVNDFFCKVADKTQQPLFPGLADSFDPTSAPLFKEVLIDVLNQNNQGSSSYGPERKDSP